MFAVDSTEDFVPRIVREFLRYCRRHVTLPSCLSSYYASQISVEKDSNAIKILQLNDKNKAAARKPYRPNSEKVERERGKRESMATGARR
jgi:hypothetical protein